MTRRPPSKGPDRDRLGLTNGNGLARPGDRGAGFTNGVGRTNGLVNGIGRTNGLTNGLTNGFTNGRGRTNGTGVINGFINGTMRGGLRRNRLGVITQRDLRYGVSLVVLFLLLLAPIAVLLSAPPKSPTRIILDADFSDWTAAPAIAFLNDPVAAPDGNDNIHLVKYSAFEENGFLSFAVSVGGIVLGDNEGVDVVHAFIDSDGNPGTGYRAREIGADYMIGVSGSNNSVAQAVLYKFTGADPRNWSGWDRAGSAAAATSRTPITWEAAGRDAANLEIQVQLDANDVLLDPAASFLIQLTDPAGSEVSSSVHFGLALRALLVTQEAATPVVQRTGDALARLTFRSFGDDVDVTNVSLRKLRVPAGVTWFSLGAFSAQLGVPESKTVPVRFTTPGDYVSARVEPAGVATGEDVPITVAGPDIVAYLGAAPADHRVDGYFGDWTSVSVAATGVPNPNIDIGHYAAAREGSTAFVYADVEGSVLGGSISPERLLPPHPTTGGGQAGPPAPLPLRVGEDAFLAFLQLNTSRPVGHPALGIYADYYLDIRGQYGEVVSKQAYEWTTGGWAPSSRAVEVANDGSRMEASLNLTGLATDVMAVAIESSDWGRYTDVTGVYSFLRDVGIGGTRGTPGPIVMDVPGNQKYYFHNTDHSTETACTYNKVADTTHGPGPVVTITLAPGEDACWYIDETTGTTIPAGTWETLLDISSGGSGAAYDVEFDIWDLSTHGIDTVIGSCTNVQDFGDDRNCQVTGVAEQTIGSTQVVRVSVTNSGSGPTVSIQIDGADTTGDSRATLPIPEFQDLFVPVAIVGFIYLVGRRRRRAPDP